MNKAPLIIEDSDLRFTQAINGSDAPLEIIDRLSLIDVLYYSFDGAKHHGQILIDCDLEDDVYEIFVFIEKLKFPIGKVIPIVEYKWNDHESMAANNSSGFNFRVIEGTSKLSMHSLGLAVDINPLQNPVIYPDGRIAPPGSIYETTKAGTFSAGHPIVQEFLKHGWHWGGNFDQPKDYHHFEKPL
jgi:peptidoglycan LD-endopeptidase CwlK